ncbi:odorant receptor 10-like [Onthophagus taurus]|uniref:odorant receptor 10-like n=1 Tax=Onthophagus taurus TaxID=166361 RepID=UPI0039BE54CF
MEKEITTIVNVESDKKEKEEKNEKRPTFQSIFATEQYLLFLTGIYIYKGKPMKPFKKFMRYLTLSFSTSLCFTMIWQMYMDRREIQKIFEALYFFFMQFGNVLKLYSFVYHKPYLDELEDILETDIFKSHKVSQDHFITDMEKYHFIIARVYQGIALFTASMYSIFPFITKHLMVPVYFGFDPEKYLYGQFIYELVCFMLNAYNNMSLDCICVALVNVASAQFEILKDYLENHLGHDDEEIEQNLQKCVKYHNAILDFVQRVEEIFTYGIFFQMISGVIILCMTGIQFLITPVKSLRFFLMTFYFITMVFQIAIYEWFGQIILEKSSDLVQCCYMSNWTDFNTKNKKMLFIIMERAKRPIILTAGYFVTLSLATFMSILRSAYSYFAVLRQMYQKQ